MPGTTNNKRSGRGNTNRNAMAELREQTAVVRSDLRELANTAGEAAWSRMDPLEAYVREKPLKSMLIAAGVGAALGFLFSKR